MASKGRDERGSASVWLAMLMPTIVVLFGLAVDVSGQLATMQRAHDAAAQAARIGGQQVNTADVQAGRAAKLVVGDAVTAARTYLAASDASSSSVQVRGGRVVVQATFTYRTKFLGIIGINQIQTTGESDARIVPALNGGEIP